MQEVNSVIVSQGPFHHMNVVSQKEEPCQHDTPPSISCSTDTDFWTDSNVTIRCDHQRTLASHHDAVNELINSYILH